MSPSIRHLLLWGCLAALGAAVAGAQVALPSSEASPTEGSRGSLRSVLRPVADIRVSSRAAGVIQTFHVEEGAKLKAGDPILSLDMDAERAEVAQAEAMIAGAKAELERATLEYERVRPLSAENIFSEKQLVEARTSRDLAASRLAQAEAARDLARSRLANRTLTSPIQGVFLKTSKSVGEAVERFETVARVIDASRLEMVVYCDARYFRVLSRTPQAQVAVVLPSGEQRTVQAAVSHVDPIIDPSSGTFRVRLQLAVTDEIAAGYTAILLPPQV